MENIVRPVAGDNSYINDIEQAILSLDVMPSMRSLMTAGPAALRDNTAMYNCSYLTVKNIKSFDHAMFILLCGTGVGFSVERQYVSKLPEIPDHLSYSETTIVVKDSKEGWAKSLRQLIALLYSGEIPLWDVSKVRPAGARLKTFGGRASGPAPLIDLFNFTIRTFKGAVGRKLSSMECHDIMCKIGEVVVVGGVRRSAMISLSNLSDDRMRHAKSGSWWENNPQRALANNSVSYTEKPDSISFMREWQALVESGSGERGIFNRQAAKVHEIILLDSQFCNLTECVIRATDSLEDLERKVKLATILGTIQSTYTHFPYLSKDWKDNTEKERLLGVSLTGIMDNQLMTLKNNGLDKTLEHLKNVAISTNAEWAELLGIPVAAAITCVKPSGTVSQLVDSSSGIHARHSPYYIRTVRGDIKDPLTNFLKDRGVPNEPCVMKPDTTVVFSFPQKSPDNAVVTADMTAIEQLEMWLMYQRFWCEHKPSVTINVRSGEWFAVGAFVYEHFDEMSGVSFLPYNEHTYQQAPYQECGRSDYKMLLSCMPDSLNWDELSDYEKEDNTAGSQTLACSGDSCEIVDLV
jgi:ribonucleoside-diphosphate reductase alpha chain